MAQNAQEIKEKILSTLRRNGPSLPVRIARETELSTLFASAFLSELFSEQKIKFSNMKVGSSPIYLLPGQEPMLEKFSEHLKSKEKEAFILLKEKKFLDDEKQEPAIKVALRAIKDFAISFQKDEKTFWRFITIPEDEFPEEKKVQEKPEIQKPEVTEQKEKLDIFNEKPKEQKAKKKSVKKISKKQDDKFFDKVKEYLTKKEIEIVDIEGFNKKDLVLKIKENNQEKLLFAFNKKKITDADIIKAYKKALEQNLQYVLLSLGEPLRKLTNLIEAIKNLSEIEKIE